MARTAITIQSPVVAGIVPTYEAANADGHMFTNTGTEILHIKNGSGSSINVTLQTGLTIDGLAVADRTVAIAAGAEKMMSGLATQYYNQTSGADAGKVYIDLSAVTTVTLAVFKSAGPA